MSDIKQHQCPSCGGNLIVDNDKQMYRCTSCGSTYDYEYFREERIHEMAETYLSRGEFTAAADAYKFKLKKEPHNFLALRGLMLAAANLKEMDDLIRKDHSKRFSYKSILVRDAVEGASEKDKGYFEELEKIYSDMRDLSKCNAEIESLGKERKRIEDEIRFEEQSRDEYKIPTGYLAGKAPLPTFTALWIIDGVLLLIMLGCLTPLIVNGEGVTALFFGFVFAFLIILFAFVNLTGIYPYVKDLKETDTYIRELNVESDLIGEKKIKLESEAEMLSAGIRNSCNAFVEKDRLILKDLISGPGSGTDTIKKHQCPSCGGSLIIDNDKQMYHCSFCGSAFDYEYFREDQMIQMGKKYLSQKEFEAVTEAYRFLLKKDPHDFLALRGLMLAAAHLKNMDDLIRADLSNSFSYDAGLVSDAVEGASEKDKKYFKQLKKIYSDMKEISKLHEEMDSLGKERRKIGEDIRNKEVESFAYVFKDQYGIERSPKTIFIWVWVYNAISAFANLPGVIIVSMRS